MTKVVKIRARLSAGAESFQVGAQRIDVHGISSGY